MHYFSTDVDEMGGSADAAMILEIVMVVGYGLLKGSVGHKIGKSVSRYKGWSSAIDAPEENAGEDAEALQAWSSLPEPNNRCCIL